MYNRRVKFGLKIPNRFGKMSEKNQGGGDFFDTLYIIPLISYQGCTGFPVPENPESSHFLEIWPNPAPTKFLAGFAGCQCSCSMFS